MDCPKCHYSRPKHLWGDYAICLRCIRKVEKAARFIYLKVKTVIQNPLDTVGDVMEVVESIVEGVDDISEVFEAIKEHKEVKTRKARKKIKSQPTLKKGVTFAPVPIMTTPPSLNLGGLDAKEDFSETTFEIPSLQRMASVSIPEITDHERKVLAKAEREKELKKLFEEYASKYGDKLNEDQLRSCVYLGLSPDQFLLTSSRQGNKA